MTSIHLTDAQRDTFAACGLIVIDGGRCGCDGAGYFADRQDGGYMVECMCGGVGSLMPEGWRILTEPCDTCRGKGYGGYQKCQHCVGGRRVVTLTATCPACGGTGRVNQQHLNWTDRACTECDQPTEPYAWPSGVVTLGRFTIPALLPVYGDYVPAELVESFCDAAKAWARLDPLPRPGQFIAHPERVA